MRMNVRKVLKIINLALFLTVFLSGCGSKDLLLGNWQEPVSGITLTFKDDNSVIVSLGETSYTMQFTEQTPNGLIIKVVTDGSIPDLTMNYSVDKTKLVITMNGSETVFERMR